MLIPLWLPWAVVVALVLPFFLNVLKYEVPPTAAEQNAGRGRRPRPEPGLGEAWGEAALVVALVVAVALTFDRVHVSNDELYDAVDRVAGSMDGTPGSSSVEDRIAAGVADRLGRAVDVELVDNAGTDDAAGSGGDYEVRLEDRDDGPVSCVGVTLSGNPATVQYLGLTVASFGCS